MAKLTLANTNKRPQLLFQKVQKSEVFELQPLRNICLVFVAKNLGAVDSLQGFPSEIGREIFDNCAADKFKDFSNFKEQTQILELFTEAYPDEFLISCKFNKLEVISELDYQIPSLIRYVQKLDLSGCRLGDSHDILPLLKTCEKLESLSLADNMLTYKGLRAAFGITTHKEMKIKNLDITRNFEINYLGVVHYIIPLKSVQKIFVSVKTSDKKEWKEKLLESNFCFQNVLEKSLKLTFENDGWAKWTIDNWHNIVKELSKQSNDSTKYVAKRERVTKRNIAQGFYHIKKERKNTPLEGEIKNDGNLYETHLYKRSVKALWPIPEAKRLHMNRNEEDDDYTSVLSLYR